MKCSITVALVAVCLGGCKAPGENTGDAPGGDTVVTVTDSVQLPAAREVAAPATPSVRPVVVGFEEVAMYFHNWPDGLVLNYAGDALSGEGDEAVVFTMSYKARRVASISAKMWTHVASPGIGEESAFRVGAFPASRTVLPDGSRRYTFETHEGLGWIVTATIFDAEFEDWFTANFASSISNEADSLVTLISSPFPLQIPQAVQRIGISFRTEAYHDGTYPRTRIEMRLTNFASLESNSTVIADVVGPVENTTDGKPTFNQGEELVLTNFYGGLHTQWVLVNNGDELVLYEKTEDEPSMDTEAEGDSTSLATRKALVVLPVPSALDFEFVGYYPMGE